MAKGDAGSSVTFQPAATKRASEIIYEQVREMIVKGRLKPGDRLPNERAMMEMFQRSRPTVREALRMLERSGYIRTSAGSNGAVVTEPGGNNNMQMTMQDALQVGHISIADMREYRIISEAAAVTWACERRTQEDLDKLRAVLDRMAASIDDVDTYVGLDPEFHGLLAAAAKNSVSVMMNQTLSSINESFMRAKMEGMTPAARKKMFKKVYKMHEEIYAAVAAQDALRARAAMEEHLIAFENDLK